MISLPKKVVVSCKCICIYYTYRLECFIRPKNVNFHVLHINIDHLVLRINVLFLMSVYELYYRAYVNKNKQLQIIKIKHLCYS